MSKINKILKKHICLDCAFSGDRCEYQEKLCNFIRIIPHIEKEIKKLIPKKKKFKHPCCQWGTCKECWAIEIHNRTIDQINKKLFGE